MQNMVHLRTFLNYFGEVASRFRKGATILENDYYISMIFRRKLL